MKKVSVIIPMYGVEKYIKDCLCSVAAQTYTNIECIIIDDCGSDNSYEIARYFIENYKGEVEFRIVRHEVNKGLSAARNTGIERAKGDFIYFLDSDDTIDEKTIEVLLKHSDNADFVMANMLGYLDETGEIHKPAKKTSKNYYYFDKLYNFMTNQEMIYLNDFGLPVNKLFRKSFIDEHQLRFDEGIYFEDDVWSFKVYSHGPKVAVISDVTYKYRWRSGSIMSLLGERHIMSTIKIADIVLDYADKTIVHEKWYVNQSVERFILSCLYMCLDRTMVYRLFEEIYDYIRKRHKPTMEFWKDTKIDKKYKIKAIHYYLPKLGKVFLRKILVAQQTKMHKLYPSQAKMPKVELSLDFWNTINDKYRS